MNNNISQTIDFSHKKNINKVNNILKKLYTVQRYYGGNKDGSCFLKAAEIFLEDIPFDAQKIIAALEEWILVSDTFPTPCDIVRHIEKAEAKLKELENPETPLDESPQDGKLQG